MKESILGALTAWAGAFQHEPFYTTVIGAGVAMALLLVLGRAFRARTLMKSEIAGGPFLMVAALSVLGVCLLWAAIDGLLYWADKPLLSQYILYWLVPAGLPPGIDESQVIGELLGTDRLPGGVTMATGLFAATAVYMIIATILGNTLAEMIALQKKPEDILREERKKKLEAEAKILAAELAREDREAAPDSPDDDANQDAGNHAEPDPQSPKNASAVPLSSRRASTDTATDTDQPEPARVVPLPDDRFGRIYKLAGHYYDHVHPEPRFLRWQKVLTISLFSLVGLGMFPAASGYLPVPLWVGMTIFAAAFKQLAPGADRQARQAARNKAADKESDTDTAPKAPRPAFCERAEIASQLWPAPGAAQRSRANAAKADVARVHARGLLDDITAALGLGRLHDHQAAAAAVFDARRSLLLGTPPRSGRQVITDALALYAVLGDGERVLHISRDAAGARAAHARFEARAEATHWKWNVLAVNLADRAGILDPGQSQPALIFADPEAVHRQLCGQASRWNTFLSGLGTIIVPAMHAYSGAPAAHLGHVLRRLERAARRARSTALGQGLFADPDTLAPRLRYLITAHPGHANLGRYVERIIGRGVERIGPEHDSAPRPRQRARTVPPGWRASDDRAAGIHAALDLRDMAERMGYSPVLHGYDDLLIAAERGASDSSEDARGSAQADEHADVVIARLSPDSYTSVPMDTAHLGSRRASRGGFLPSVSILWQPDRAPLAEILATERPPLDHPDLIQSRALVAWPGAPLIERAHLRATLAESETSAAELGRLFSRECMDRELADLRAQGRLIERERRLLDVHAGAIRTVPTLAMATSEDIHASVSLRTTDQAWHLCERATGDVLGALEGARARGAAYPGRVLVTRGRRFTVVADENQDQLDRARILCEQSDAAVQSTPVRTLYIELVERRQPDSQPDNDSASTTKPGKGEDDSGGIERRRSAMRSLGGVRFSLQQREVTVTETVTGVRRFDLRGNALDTTLYDQPIQCTYTTRATVLGFASDELPPTEDVSAETLHAVAHGYAEALRVLLYHGDDDLAIAPLPRTDIWSMPALAFVDMHPGGAGYSDAITLDIIRALSRWTLALIRGCPDKCDSGCASCLQIMGCRAPGEHYQRLDKRGAESLLAAILGEPDAARATTVASPTA